MEKIKGPVILVATIGYFILGLFQLNAIYTLFYDKWDWWFIFAAPASLFIALTPILNVIVGTYSAHTVWGWSLLSAALLFLWPQALFIFVTAVTGIGAAAESVVRFFSRKNP